MAGIKADYGVRVGLGAAAGLAGTCVMIAMRTFDEHYAPKTIAKVKQDPGQFMVKQAERLTGSLPQAIEQSAAMATHTGYGTFFGVLYGMWRGRGRQRTALRDGIVLGTAVYLAGQLGWLPAIGLAKPVWKDSFPEIGGELLRHIAFGIATAATFGLIEKKF